MSLEEKILREVEEFPSTNMTRLYRHAGRVLPDCIGGGCLWLAAKLGGRLRQRFPGRPVFHYDLGSPGSHTTTVLGEGADRLVFEPSVFQASPFPLRLLAANAEDCWSQTYPLEAGYRVRLRFRWVRLEEVLKMEMVSPRGYTLREYVYQFRSPMAVAAEDPYAGLPFIEKQDTIYVHVLNPDWTKTMLTLGTQTRRLNIGRQSDRLFIESEPGFDSRFSLVAEKLQVSKPQLHDLLHEALEIHNGQYPAAC